jgi:hypothetical protein
MTDQVETVASTETSTATSQDVTTTTTNEQNNQQGNGILTSKDPKTATTTQPDWPTDWLDKMVGDDEKARNVVGRYASPKEVGESLVAMNRKLSSTRPQIELPKDPKPEDIAAYRKAYNIPEAPEGYDTKLENGLIIGEEDKGMVDAFLKRAHSRHAKPEEVKAAIQDYFEMQQAQNKEIQDRFIAQRQEAEDSLRSEWGNDYRQNVNIVSNFLQNKFGDTTQHLLDAVLTDGTVLQDNPKIIRALLQIAKESDPVATIGGTYGSVQSIEKEYQDLKQMLATNPDKYWGDQRNVDRFTELSSAINKLKQA